ncbi:MULTISPECIES: FadR/GntR family transcriptional regulator [Aneurinibacillus]|uniref:DNA-binding transcriptional regulator, FadR family n=1 Tax=Aneurinibacillus thermoaerophilus TaxID=143495 RepID=A0A1G7YVA0_ANETH|nr:MULTISPECIES: FadR/GntR family transcriptional regulator [Aneurinibacillus]AMA73181.1 GntR family transcriptional regulator [Aneurinibacillus sp. XH2]MED0674395.1 FadR/GntR family transcriptional regulator [Aneurinibacillus thermoaerophilus]MED0678413.1 FadR/GntR family transcriptional regulator [Aneurinibacillus thermoaerophilus]MED0736062.1 FadR/GntR family transcriptional regulator [Aneurinibacillus thermoaerophilus]MED0758694.1 FadR/GntR family transcriptional regulator [Aneurinibacillu
MKLQKTNRMTLVEQVAAQIEAIIESGQWPIGTRIPAEPELVRELGVSRNTLREAIRALVHAGLLRTKQGDGTYVCSTSVLGAALQRRIQQSNILETLEVRDGLEQQSARLAALRRTDEDVEKLRACLAACDSAAEANDMDAYVEFDIQLHQAVAEATHNSVLIDLYEYMTEAVKRSIRELVEVACCDSHQKVHHELIEAIIQQDERQAVEAVRTYIEQFKEKLQQHLEDEK